jgi:hypothetical protein
MPSSHCITLPIDRVPRWPRQCVLCGRDNPGSEFRFRAARYSWNQLLTMSWAIGSRPLLQAPACAHCAARLRRHRIARGLLSWVVLLPIAFVIVHVLDRTGMFAGPLHPWRKPIAGAIIIPALLPYLLWDALNPPTVNATAHGRNIDYEFADRHAAERFAQENRNTDS